MPYNTSEKVIDRMLPLLRRLEAGERCTWQVAGDDSSHSLAYRIREALFAAKQHPKKYPKLRSAFDTYSIVVVNPQLVAAVPKLRGRMPKAVILGQTEGLPTVAAEPKMEQEDLGIVQVNTAAIETRVLENYVAESTPTTRETITVEGAQTRWTVIGLLAKHAGCNLYLPQAKLSDEDLTKLFKWAKVQEPKLMLLTAPPDPALTVAAEDPEVLDLQWQPTPT